MFTTQTAVDFFCLNRSPNARRFIRLLLLTIFIIAISGCGSSGGDGGNDDPVIPHAEPPTEPSFVSPAYNAVTVDGKVWLQPADFTGYIFEQVKAVCPGPDGVCSGSLQGSTFDLTGYKWASIMDVSSLFNSYGVNPPFTETFQERRDENAAAAFSRDFAETLEDCFGDCEVTT